MLTPIPSSTGESQQRNAYCCGSFRGKRAARVCKQKNRAVGGRREQPQRLLLVANERTKFGFDGGEADSHQAAPPSSTVARARASASTSSLAKELIGMRILP